MTAESTVRAIIAAFPSVVVESMRPGSVDLQVREADVSNLMQAANLAGWRHMGTDGVSGQYWITFRLPASVAAATIVSEGIDISRMTLAEILDECVGPWGWEVEWGLVYANAVEANVNLIYLATI